MLYIIPIIVARNVHKIGPNAKRAAKLAHADGRLQRNGVRLPLNSLIPGEYERRARLAPALLVSLPPTLAVVCWFPNFSWPQLASSLVLPAFLGLLAQIGRDQGKRLEPKLFQKWGGKPTTQLLRFSCPLLAVSTRDRYRRKLQELMPDLRLPSRLEEATDPDEADAVYDSCALYLREKTRDTKAFPLVFSENVDYGMRRNLLGMKPAGISLSIAGLVAAMLATILGTKDGQLPAFPALATLANAFMLTFWLVRITPEWVRVPAFAYAERLLAACDSLPMPVSRPSGAHSVSTE